MIADSVWNLVWPWISLDPVNTSTKLVDRYRRISSGYAFVMAAAVSSALAVVSGILGGIAVMYLYDRANSKGNDLTVGLGGFFAVGTFLLVVTFTWLQQLHHVVSSRTPLFAFYACLVLPAVITVLSLSEIDDHYLPLVLGDWLAILVLGLLSLFVCRQWSHDAEQDF